MTPERTERMTSAHKSLRLSNGDPPESCVLLLLAQSPGVLLVPTGMTRSVSRWLGQANAYYGLGFPSVLKDMRTKLVSDLHDLDSHPALWGHGMLGYVNTPPLGVWRIPGARYPEALYRTSPGGAEGFLVPIYDHGKGRTTFTAWTFEEMPHGSIRPESTWFNPAFAMKGNREDLVRDAIAAQARVVKELRSDEADPDEESD